MLVIIGVLSTIAIARFLGTKEAAYVASMKADLRNFAIYEQNSVMEPQGAYFAGNGLSEGFVPSPGVAVLATADLGPPPSWHAVASHNKTSKTCSISTTGPSIWEIDCP